ncbi:MAG TPA: hypothetical protein VND19_02735 [Acetobacteraceae bacterium]|nr:hypothetical protein [Acetobacteraceae bacterium]
MSAFSPTARHEYYAELGNSLPPPVLDQPEYRERRHITAVETFEALRPGDAYEASLAMKIVLCGARAVEGLRLAGVHRDDFAKMTRCCAQAASMMRAESAAKRALEREQKVRLATEAVANTPQAHPATASAPPPQAEPQAPPPVQATAAAPPPAAVPPPAAPPLLAVTQSAPPPAQAGSTPSPSPEAIAKAEAFADEDIVAAAQIRHDRGVTPQNKAYFRHLALPTDPAMIDALVRGTSAVLNLLDEVGGETLHDAA